jgi:photosystem II stability/assembly factor-like uncharacterized protein
MQAPHVSFIAYAKRRCTARRPRPMVFLAVASALILVGQRASHAWVGVWTGGGGSIAAVAVDPTTPTIIYAGSSASVFKSTDAGSTWVRKSFPTGVGGVETLAIDPENPATIYAGTTVGGVVKSTDAGETWTTANTGLPTPVGLFSFYQVTALAIDPTVSTTVYIATSFGELFKSIDGGADWRETDAGLRSPNFSVTTLAIDPERPATIYVGTSGGGVFKSTDAAATWTPIDTGLPSDLAGLPIAVVAIDPAVPATIYAASAFGTSAGGVFKSVDGGMHWANADTGLPYPDVTALVVDPTRADTLYAGVTGLGIFETTDGGSSWSVLGTRVTNAYVHVQTLAISGDGTTLYAGTWEGLFDLELEARAPTPVAPCSSVRCTLDTALMDRMCLDESIPGSVTRRFDRAVRLIDGAATPSGRRARTLLKRASRILDRAGKKASRDVPGRRRPHSSAAPAAISVGCAAALKAAANYVAVGLGG